MNDIDVPWWKHPRGIGWVLSSAGLAILYSGFYGVVWGMVAGGITGTCVFPVIGTLFGAVIGIPYGFVAGLIGGTIGGRLGGALGGTLAGLAGGFTLCGMLGLLNASTMFLGMTAGFERTLFTIFVLTAPGILGGFIGFRVGRGLEYEEPVFRSQKGSLQSCIQNSGLILLPWWYRVLIGLFVLLSLVSIGVEIAVLMNLR